MTSQRKITSFQTLIWLMMAEAGFVCGYLLSLPADPEHAWLLGYSQTRVLLIGVSLVLALFLAWLGLLFSRGTKTSKKIRQLGNALMAQRVGPWFLTAGLILITVGGLFFLVQWKFIASDQQLRAYFQRLAPFALFATVTGIQFLVYIRKYFTTTRAGTLYILTLLGGYCLFGWLLVGEYFLADAYFPALYVEKSFGGLLQSWLPVIIFQTAVYAQFPYLLRERLGISLSFRWIGYAVFLVIVFFYIQAAQLHAAEVNTNLSRSDQDVYVEFTGRVVESQYAYSGERNQTPGYPYIQALFCREDNSTATLFACGKQVNIYLSVFLLILLFPVFRWFLPPQHAYSLLLIVTIGLFVFKAGYMTAELTYYFFGYLSFTLMAWMLIRPTFKKGLAAGIILGLTHLIKASILPGLGLFAVLYLGKETWQAVSRKSEIPALMRKIAMLGLTLLCFGGVIFPYIRESKAIYGQYFYNVNSTFYIWYDNFDEAKLGEYAFGFKQGWPDAPHEELPGPGKYLQDHTLPQVFARIFSGLGKQLTHLWNAYSLFNYLIFYLSMLAVFVLISTDQMRQLIRQYLPAILFVVFYVVGYLLLFAWYNPIAGGPRFIQGLYMPLLFSAFWGLKTLMKGPMIQVRRLKASRSITLRWVNAVILAVLMADGFVVITQILPQGYFGS